MMKNKIEMSHGILVIDSINITVEHLLAIDIACMTNTELTVILDTDIDYIDNKWMSKHEEYKYTWLRTKYKDTPFIKFHSIYMLRQNQKPTQKLSQKMVDKIFNSIETEHTIQFIKWKEDLIISQYTDLSGNANLAGIPVKSISEEVSQIKELINSVKKYDMIPNGFTSKMLKKVSIFGTNNQAKYIMLRALANVFNTSYSEDVFRKYTQDTGIPIEDCRHYDYEVLCKMQFNAEEKAVNNSNGEIAFIDSNYAMICISNKILSKNPEEHDTILQYLRNYELDYKLFISVNPINNSFSKAVHHSSINCPLYSKYLKIQDKDMFEGFKSAISKINDLLAGKEIEC